MTAPSARETERKEREGLSKGQSAVWSVASILCSVSDPDPDSGGLLDPDPGA